MLSFAAKDAYCVSTVTGIVDPQRAVHERDSPHAEHIRGAGGAAQPGSQALLRGLTIHIVGGQEETAAEETKERRR